MKHVGIVVCSVRAQRIGLQVAEWVQSIMTKIDSEIVDLREWQLPMDDEPGLPVDGVYTQQHTKLWSEKITSLSAFVFVTPQYNWGYPASLKNAVDHLYHEWSGKPALTVSYGYQGGSKCADQLIPVFTRLQMKVLNIQPQLVITREMHGTDGLLLNPTEAFSSFEPCFSGASVEMIKLLGD